MALSLQLPNEAARLWSIPDMRAKILAMHASDMPLLEMVHELGLDHMLEADGLGEVVAGLSTEDVQVIRNAFIAEAREAEKPGAIFPIDCRVDDHSNGVTIEAAPFGDDDDGRSLVRVKQVGSQA
jgi:hypothetical protein